jgi:hypothetical protein
VDNDRRMAGEHPAGHDSGPAMAGERRVLVRFAIERAGPNVAG